MASSYEISLSPFSDQKTFWNDENATGKKEVQFLCHDCSVNHFTLIQCLWKRGKWPFWTPYKEGILRKRAATFDYPLFSSWAALIHDVSEYKQSSKMQQCKPWTIYLGSQDLRKAEAELLQSLPLERNGMLYFYVHIFFLVCEIFWSGMWFYFQPSLWFNF